MAHAGLGLTIVGAVFSVAAVAWFAITAPSNTTGNPSDDDSFAGIGSLIGGCLAGFGVTHLIVGVSLLANGARAPSNPAAPAVALRLAPTVGAGPRSVSLGWAF
jgi:hypothetical protein